MFNALLIKSILVKITFNDYPGREYTQASGNGRLSKFFNYS